MATLFSVVYDKFLRIIKDLELAKLSDEDIKDVLFNYLENASVEFRQCKKNLSDIVYPQNSLILYNGDARTFEFDINPIPYDLEWNVVVDNKILQINKDYTIDMNNKKIKFVKTPSLGNNNVGIAWNFDGQFNDTLSNEEILIIVQGCVLHWLQPMLLRERGLKEAVGDRDYNRGSTANLLDKLIKLDDTYT
jgi:hypothetical protein